MVKVCPSGSVTLAEQVRVLEVFGPVGVMVVPVIIEARFSTVFVAVPVSEPPDESVAVAWQVLESPGVAVVDVNVTVSPRPMDVVALNHS